MGRFQRLVTFISSAWLDAVLHLTPSPIKSHGENYDNILLRWISIAGLPRSLDSCMYCMCFCITFSYWVRRLIIGQHQIFIKMLRIFLLQGKPRSREGYLHGLWKITRSHRLYSIKRSSSGLMKINWLIDWLIDSASDEDDYEWQTPCLPRSTSEYSKPVSEGSKWSGGRQSSKR